MDSTTITNTFWSLITPEMAPVIACVYGVCFALKRADFFSDRLIPLAALALGIVFEIMMAAAFTRTALLDGVIRGIMCGMAAVYAANIVKQFKGGCGEDDNTDANS